MKKKGVSNVVAVILLILLTIILVTTLWTYVLPIVRDSINYGKDCQEALSSIYIESVCVGDTSLFVSIARGPDNVQLVNIQLGFEGRKGKIKTVQLVEDDSNFSEEDLPGINEKILIIRGAPDSSSVPNKIGIAPLIRVGNTNHLCQMSPLMEVSDCADEI